MPSTQWLHIINSSDSFVRNLKIIFYEHSYQRTLYTIQHTYPLVFRFRTKPPLGLIIIQRTCGGLAWGGRKDEINTLTFQTETLLGFDTLIIPLIHCLSTIKNALFVTGSALMCTTKLCCNLLYTSTLLPAAWTNLRFVSIRQFDKQTCWHKCSLQRL